MAAPPEGPAIRRIATDGLTIAAVLLVAALTLFANRARSPAPWPPPSPQVSRAALARDPLDAAALRNLGLTLDRNGDPAGADRLLTFAGSRSQRDTPTEDWLLVRRLSQGRYDEAFRAADALLRRDIGDGQRASLTRLLVAAAHYDASRPAVIARLAAGPWWRAAVLRELAARADPADTQRVMGALATSRHPPTDAELGPYLERMVQTGDIAAAARDWGAFSTPPRDPSALNDLRAPPPFGWSAVSGDGASAGVDGGALRVDYDGYATPQLPRRLVALAPGPRRLVWRERSDTHSRMAVEVRCAGADAVLAKSAPEAVGNASLRALTFVVPASGCDGQWVAIIPVPADRRAPVSTLFSDWYLTAPPPR